MKKTFIYSFLLKACSILTSFVVTALLARNLSISDFGLVALATSLLTLLALPSQAGISQFVIRSVAKSLAIKNEVGLSSLRKKSLIISIMSSSLLSLITIAVLHSYYMKHDSVLLLFSFFVLPLHAVSLLNSAFTRGMNHVIPSQIPDLLVRNLVNALGLYGYTVLYNHPLETDVVVQVLIYSHIASLLVSAIIYTLFSNKIASKHEEDIFCWASFRKVIPLTMISAVYVVNTQYDILVISYYLLPSDVGVYKAAVQLGVLMTVSLTVVQQIMQPRVVNLYVSHKIDKLQDLMQVVSLALFCFSLVLFFVFLIFGKIILMQAFGEVFSKGYWCLILLSVGQLVNAYFGPLGTVLNMAEKEHLVLKSAVISMLINVTSSTFLVINYGAIGAAIGTMVSLIAFNLSLYVSVVKRIGIKPLAHQICFKGL